MKPTILRFACTSPMRLLALLMMVMLSGACSGPHFLPACKPLFVGLDETGMSARARSVLAAAKHDFELARKGRTPRYASLACSDPVAESKTYQGRGYKLTIFNGGPRHRMGPKIDLEPVVTGGGPYSYDESSEHWD